MICGRLAIKPLHIKLRYDNETGKGDHRHFAGKERAYVFKTPDKLIADFQRDIARWNRESRDA